ncbi:MAG: tetratricopeptide repeat protein [Campylobacteraceae bacterium]|jgi:outer membrane protein assembly factor BamD|nr:tetratricopeptide repeat protein [Campylobacteraceae bacterium]
MNKNSVSKIKLAVSAVAALAILSGCSSKQEEFNKPADYWYQKMVKETMKGDLEQADKTFTSLQSEHIRSPLISEAMLILAQAHMDNEEYILANYYLDEYIKRFGDKKSAEFAKYLKVKANFMAFKKPYRDQQLLIDTQKDSEEFIKEYPNSVYRPYVETMVLKLALGNKLINESIAGLYKRIDKPEASKKYAADANISWLNKINSEKPNTPWYRAIFEVQLQ